MSAKIKTHHQPPAEPQGPPCRGHPQDPRGHPGDHRNHRREVSVPKGPGHLGGSWRPGGPRNAGRQGPRALIESALRTAPPVFTLAARDPSQDLPLDGNHVYVGTDGCGIEVIDIETGVKRRSTVRDVADIARVADDLEEVAFHWVPVSAQDCPPETRGLHELLAIWSNSTKHVQTESIYSGREARAAVEMASVLAGGRDALRKRPLLSIMECTISPLAQDGGSLEAALVGAEVGLSRRVHDHGLLRLHGTGHHGREPRCGQRRGPQRPGPHPARLPRRPGVLRRRARRPWTSVRAPTREAVRRTSCSAPLPMSWPIFTMSRSPWAPSPRAPRSPTGRPAWKTALSTFMASAVMSDMLLGVGLLNGSTIWSFEQMIMDCEIFRIIRKMMEGIPVDAETLALEAIREVGPGGIF